MNNKTVLMAAVLAIATVLAAGLTVLPSSVQEAQANPCATETEQETNVESDTGAATGSSNANQNPNGSTDNRECTFIGPVDIDED
jgi:hypothetical protein